MSTSLPLDQFAFLYYTITFTRYALASTYTLTVYEWLYTLAQEVEQIHRMKWCTIKIAFLLCRYYPLLSYPFVMWAYIGNHPAHLCVPLVHPINALFFPFLICPQAVMLIRAYAFTNKKRAVLALLIPCFIGLVAIESWVFLTNPPSLPESFYEISGVHGCFPNYSTSVMGIKVGVLQLSAILMDFLSLMVVVLHCRKEILTRSYIARFFLGQGLWAFAAVFVINVIASVFFFIPNWIFNRFGLPYVSLLSNIIACRVILQLRAKANPSEYTWDSSNGATVLSLTQLDSPIGSDFTEGSVAWDTAWTIREHPGEYPES